MRPRRRWPVRLAVLLIAVVWLVPTVGLLLSSFRTRAFIEAEGWWTAFADPFAAGQWTLDNYVTVLGASRGFGNAFVNSLAVSIPSTVIPITVAAFAAYAFSWMRFPGRRTLFIVVVALLAVPVHVALIPILRLYTQGAALGGITLVPDLDLVGTFPAMWFAHTGFGLPLAVYLLRNYIGSLPSELIESARVDGASHLQIFARLVVPLSVPALAAFATLQFLWIWNDLLVALVFLGGTQDVRVLHGRARRGPGRLRSEPPPAAGGRVRDHGPADGGVLLAPAVLRAWPDGRRREGMTCASSRRR